MLKRDTLKDILNTPSADKWRRIGLGKRAGLLVPLFSVYSKDSIGIGDLDDLKLVIDFAEKTSNSIVQLLPMNEVGGLFCPYDALSSFALEPMYLSLRQFAACNQPGIKERIKEIRQRFTPQRAGGGLTAKPYYVDYSVKSEKTQVLWDIFISQAYREQGLFRDFIEENKYWLEDFALFKVLKERHQGRPWYEWQDRYKHRDAPSLRGLRSEHEKQIGFETWVQWQLYRQFKLVKQYAQSKGILVKGDLPLLVSRDSADVWAHPQLFKLDFASGAPPDMYCAKGQRWGMPPHDWEGISADNYRYLKERLKFAENFYDIVRIDHTVGLFRIWSIPYEEPLENKGLNGCFDPKDENKWAGQGKTILSLINDNTQMLICAEDLGTVPKECPLTLKEMGIAGYDVQRWKKDWRVRHDFSPPEEYRPLSAAVLSTHDTTNWFAWWENEAGTVDEALFIRKCAQRRIDYDSVKNQLFDFNRSRYGRLRWLDKVACRDILVNILGRKKEQLKDFIDIYENSFQEKEKLWKKLRLKGKMRERADARILGAALKFTLESNSIFCLQTIVDYFYLTGLLEEDPYNYRINTPGTISDKNWSLTIPLMLEELLNHKACKQIRNLIVGCRRGGR